MACHAPIGKKNWHPSTSVILSERSDEDPMATATEDSKDPYGHKQSQSCCGAPSRTFAKSEE